MLFSTANQAQIFIWMMAAGVVMGAIFALFEILRRMLHPNLILSLLLDVVLGGACAVVFIVALVLGNYGRVRFFEVAAAILGAALFEFGFQPPIRALMRRTRRDTVQIKAWLSKNRLIKALFR